MALDLDPSMLFEHHPDAMWIYDLDTLRFLAVNDAAIQRYGYTREEFLGMTIREIRPEEDIPRLLESIKLVSPGLEQVGTWRHRLKSGELIFVDIRTHILDYQGHSAELVAARDLTRQRELERERLRLLEREQQLRLAAEAAAQHFQGLFEAVPGNFLVLDPLDYSIVAVSDAYLEATMRRREELKGRPLTAVFADDPDDPAADGLANVLASLERVKRSGATDIMAVQRYPIRRPDSVGGGYEERYWSSVNTPIRGPDGDIVYLIHRAEDVTEVVVGEGKSATSLRALRNIAQRDTLLELDILLRSQELKRANNRLLEQEAHLRTAQRLLGLGVWKQNLDTGEFTWSDNIYRMYGASPDGDASNTELYRAQLHPQDREAMLASDAAYRANPGPHYEFQHRIIRPDGQVAHLRGIGEYTETGDGRILTGVVQDVTAEVEAAARLEEVTRLQRLAGRAAHLGGWRADLAAGLMQWTEETALIHDLPGASDHALDDAFSYYAPADGDRLREQVAHCLEQGEGFDEVTELITAKGARRWVRAIGEPEYDAAGSACAVRGALQDITELVRAREQSETLSRRLHQSLESMSDAFVLMDHAFCFSYVNRQAEQLLRQPKQVLLGRYMWDLFPDASEFREHYERALASGESTSFTSYFDPLESWFQVNAYPGSEGLAIYFQDVSRERGQEQQLRLLEAAVAQQNDMLMITEAEPLDAPGGPRVVYVNEAFVRRTGYSRADIVGATPRVLQGPNTDRGELARIGAALRAGRAVRTELVNYTRAGQEMWLELDIAPLAGDTGQISHWVAVQRDISTRKQMELDLHERVKELRCLYEVASLSADRDGPVSTVLHSVAAVLPHALVHNERAVARIHHDAEEFRSPGWREPERASTVAIFQGRLETGWIEVGYWGGDEAGVAGTSPLLPEELEMLNVVAVHIGQMLVNREAAQRLAQSEKLSAIGQLTGGVAHDFNNLLTVILGNAELLNEQLEDQPQLRALAGMTVTAAHRGAELTDRLLAFSRRQVLEPQVVDINRLISGMESLLQRALTEDIDIRMVCAEGLWCAEVDPGELESALLNLAINARDAMPRGGHLTIETANTVLDEVYAEQHDEVRSGQYVMVSVSDTGSGMPPEIASRVFEPFFTTKQLDKGSGLGLSMVYGFVKQSGGHAKIYSEPGEGTTVKLYFPQENGAGEAAPVSAPDSTVVGGREHLLVVEDSDLVREHVINLLQGLGYRISSANSAPAAERVLRESTDIDLLFTDVVMPGGMNGRELADLARQLRPGIRVLFTSGYTENAIVHHGRLDRGVHLLGKPYRRQELAAKLRKVLDEEP